jgi:hypothetical protein
MVLLDDPTEMTQNLILKKPCMSNHCRLVLIQSVQSMLNAAQSRRFRLGNHHLKQDLERFGGMVS